jgi:hypothetical protein
MRRHNHAILTADISIVLDGKMILDIVKEWICEEVVMSV